MSDAKEDKNKDSYSEWLGHWESNAMAGFQVDKPHPKIVEHYDTYTKGKPKCRVFFPLCGDTYDMKVLAERGHEVVGVECSELAIKSFFEKHKVEFTSSPMTKLEGKVFKSNDGRYKIFCCDFFKFNSEIDGKYDVILDFGSIGAIHRPELEAYAKVIKDVMSPDCCHMIECFVYDVEAHPNGRPICFTLEHLQKLFGDKCSVEKFDEGPDPYADMFQESEEKDRCDSSDKTDDKSKPEEKHDWGDDDFPEYSGTAYFLLKPK